MYEWRYVCVCMCMSVLCLRDGCIFCVTFPALAFSYLFEACIWSSEGENYYLQVADICSALTSSPLYSEVNSVMCNICLCTTNIWNRAILLMRYTHASVSYYFIYQSLGISPSGKLQNPKWIFPFWYASLRVLFVRIHFLKEGFEHCFLPFSVKGTCSIRTS